MESSYIENTLKRKIGSGAIKQGERLVENQLCKQFGVGRGKIREALKRLEHEGFVKITPYVGAMVTEFSQKDIEQIYDLMGVLEGLSMLVTTVMLHDNDVQKIESIVEQMESTGDQSEFFQLNKQFHSLLSSLGDNPTLNSFMEVLRGRALVMGLQSLYNPEQIKASILEHRKILKAIKEAKPQRVEKLIRDHYLKAKNRYIRYLNKTL